MPVIPTDLLVNQFKNGYFHEVSIEETVRRVKLMAHLYLQGLKDSDPKAIAYLHERFIKDEYPDEDEFDGKWDDFFEA